MNDYGTDVSDTGHETTDLSSRLQGTDHVGRANDSADLGEAHYEPSVPAQATEAPSLDDVADSTVSDPDDRVVSVDYCELPEDLGRATDLPESETIDANGSQDDQHLDLGRCYEAETLETWTSEESAESEPLEWNGPLSGNDIDDTDLYFLQKEVVPHIGSAENPRIDDIRADSGAADVHVETDASVEQLAEEARNAARSTEEVLALNDVETAYAGTGTALSDDDCGRALKASDGVDTAEPDVISEISATAGIDLPDNLANSPDSPALLSSLEDMGMSLVSVDRFDYRENPVLGYRPSASPEDIAYAVKTWNDQIAPGLSAGATRDDFEAYDSDRGLEGHRRLAGVYDYMLGDDAIKSSGQRGDGTLDVIGGRHRIEQARLHGVKYLPVKIL